LLPFHPRLHPDWQSSPMFWRRHMSGNRLVLLTLALLAGCGGDKGKSSLIDDSDRDLQRPGVDASAPLNDHGSKPATKSSTKTASKPAAKATSMTLSSGTAISA